MSRCEGWEVHIKGFNTKMNKHESSEEVFRVLELRISNKQYSLL